MGTVCYAPDIPLLDRPLNPYNGLPIPSTQLRRSSVDLSLARKMVEDYQTPSFGNSLMRPSNLNHLPVASSVQVTTTTVPITSVPPPLPPPISRDDPSAIMQRLHSSPEAAIHGPPLELAAPCDMPPITENIMQRRKRLRTYFRN